MELCAPAIVPLEHLLWVADSVNAVDAAGVLATYDYVTETGFILPITASQVAVTHGYVVVLQTTPDIAIMPLRRLCRRADALIVPFDDPTWDSDVVANGPWIALGGSCLYSLLSRTWMTVEKTRGHRLQRMATLPCGAALLTFRNSQRTALIVEAPRDDCTTPATHELEWEDARDVWAIPHSDCILMATPPPEYCQPEDEPRRCAVMRFSEGKVTKVSELVIPPHATIDGVTADWVLLGVPPGVPVFGRRPTYALHRMRVWDGVEAEVEDTVRLPETSLVHLWGNVVMALDGRARLYDAGTDEWLGEAPCPLSQGEEGQVLHVDVLDKMLRSATWRRRAHAACLRARRGH
jgi:hypothetical protein